MLLLLLVALLLLTITWFMQMSQYCTTNIILWKHKTDRTTFNFFPLSFLCYVSLLISLSIFITTSKITDHFNDALYAFIFNWDLLFKYSFEFDSTITIFQHHYLNFNRNSLLQLQHMHTEHITDHILIYGVMLISLWNSFFLCYMHYLALSSLKDLTIVSSCKIFKVFSAYATVFCALFALQIHFYYWLYPVLIFYHFAMNLYWAKKFGSLLMSHIRKIEESGAFVSDLPELKQKIVFKKRVLFTCCVLFIIQLSALTITYNVDIIYYLPLLWSISAFIFAFVFARNYENLERLFDCKCCKQHQNKVNSKHSISSITTVTSSASTTPKTQETNATDTQTAPASIEHLSTQKHLAVPNPILSTHFISQDHESEVSKSDSTESNKYAIDIKSIDTSAENIQRHPAMSRSKSVPIYVTEQALSPFKCLAQHGLYSQRNIYDLETKQKSAIKYALSASSLLSY